jgi:hypothetical protein
MRRVSCVVLLSLGLIGLINLAIPSGAQAQVICNGNASPPPELPVYDQPPMPAPGYLWTPGYWGGGPLGYFWVPGTWVEPPSVGLLWTPGYWGWRDGIYVWNAGYWGPRIGFYGGVNYGFGYAGVGYQGGRWANGVFSYNETVNNFGSVHITNVYRETIINNNVTRVSFNGGTGGTTARPTAEEEAAAHEHHVAAIPAQAQQERTAGANKELLASENDGRPAIAATAKPGEFTGKGVVAAREAPPGEVHAPNAAVRPGEKPLGQEGIAPRATEKEGVTPRETEKEGVKPRETLKEEGEPRTKAPPAANESKLPEEKRAPANTQERLPNKETNLPPKPEPREAEPKRTEPKEPHEQAKLPGEKPETPAPRAKPAAGEPKTAHEPPHAAAEPHPHPPAKPAEKEKKPE